MVEERIVDDLTDLLFTSMQSMVSLNKLVTELTEDVSRLTLSLAHLKEDTAAFRTELEKKISDMTVDIVALKDSDTCEQLKPCRMKEEEAELEDKEEDAISPIDGAWSCWSDWPECSEHCGGGNRTRTRTCTNPAPAHGGAQCERNSSETQKCNSHACPIDGGWTNWTEWTNCSAVCGGGIENRTRTCTNPVPAHGGAPCEGNSSEAQNCNSHACPVDGGWTNWTDWTECSADCEGGNQRRTRTCTNPAPDHGGAECDGSSSESRSCNSHACPIDGGWSSWSDWSRCVSTISEHCGSQGSQIRSRGCTNPAPVHGGTDCLGNTQETQYCTISCTVSSVKVLKFVESSNSAYIGRRPDMEPLRDELSVCAWIKKLRSGDNAIWFDYNMSGEGDAMCISDTEYWNCMINQCTFVYKNRVSVTIGTWHHHCSTWRRSTGTHRVYHNGVMIEERTTPGGTLKLGGYLAIGNEAYPGTAWQFGGEMTKLNVFSKELTAAEVRAMKDAGIFSSIERNHEEDRYFKWEDILTWERGGTIRERIMTTAD